MKKLSILFFLSIFGQMQADFLYPESIDMYLHKKYHYKYFDDANCFSKYQLIQLGILKKENEYLFEELKQNEKIKSDANYYFGYINGLTDAYSHVIKYMDLKANPCEYDFCLD